VRVSRGTPWTIAAGEVFSGQGSFGNGAAMRVAHLGGYFAGQFLWCAFSALDDYRAALWRTAAGAGDVDTTCARVGGMVSLAVGRAGLPTHWLGLREPLPTGSPPEETQPIP
jgi:ADP-ribosylglycohydrolase